jgi:hypothetical protein
LIDITRPIKTKSGKRVIGLKYKEYNSCGKRVTYPLKGSIVVREKPLKLEYCIWSEDGIYDVVWKKNSELDIVEIK